MSHTPLPPFAATSGPRSAKILIVDDEHYTRKVIRTLLTTIGVRQIVEACDGLAGIEAIKGKLGAANTAGQKP